MSALPDRAFFKVLQLCCFEKRQRIGVLSRFIREIVIPFGFKIRMVL